MRFLYASWLVSLITLFGYVIARPEASVVNPTDAAVLLPLLALSLTFISVRWHFIMIHLVKTLQHVMMYKLQGNAASSTKWTTTTMVNWILWPQIVATAIAYPLLIAILPNAVGVATTSPEQLEMYLRAAWVCLIVTIFIHGTSIIPITWAVHRTVSDSIAAFATPQGGSDESSLERRMRALDVRMRRNAIHVGISVVLSLALFSTAVAVGMKYWYVCSYASYLTGAF